VALVWKLYVQFFQATENICFLGDPRANFFKNLWTSLFLSKESIKNFKIFNYFWFVSYFKKTNFWRILCYNPYILLDPLLAPPTTSVNKRTCFWILNKGFWGKIRLLTFSLIIKILIYYNFDLLIFILVY
jgi:hypothetical protein